MTLLTTTPDTVTVELTRIELCELRDALHAVILRWGVRPKDPEHRLYTEVAQTAQKMLLMQEEIRKNIKRRQPLHP